MCRKTSLPPTISLYSSLKSLGFCLLIFCASNTRFSTTSSSSLVRSFTLGLWKVIFLPKTSCPKSPRNAFLVNLHSSMNIPQQISVRILEWEIRMGPKGVKCSDYVHGHASWTRLQKGWFCYAFFIFTPFKCWYLSQMDRYLHESGLILKLIKGTTTPVNMRSIAFQMGAGCVLEWSMVRVVEGGEAVHTNSMGKSRFACVSQVKVE